MFEFLGKSKQQRFAEGFERAKQIYAADNSNVRSAIDELEKALAIHADTADAWVILADWYDALHSRLLLSPAGDDEKAAACRVKARECAQKAVNLAPGNARAHYVLGNILWGSWNNPVGALNAYEAAAKLDPQYDRAAANMRSTVREMTLTLARLNLSLVSETLREDPPRSMLEMEFVWSLCEVRSAIIYQCYRSGSSGKLWVDACLFQEEQPDFFTDIPVGRVLISSEGKVQVSTPDMPAVLAARSAARKMGM